MIEEMELSQARKIAENIVNTIKSSVIRYEIAGSIRRKKQTVKDVELVVIVDDYSQFYKLLAKHGRFIKPGVNEIIDWPPKHGAKYIRMLLNENIKLDIFVASVNNWGSLLCMRTGSATNAAGEVFGGFIPRMFAKWKKVSKGGKMSGCQPTMPDGLMLDVLEEIDFFNLCGVEWVEPEFRTDSKALKNKHV